MTVPDQRASAASTMAPPGELVARRYLRADCTVLVVSGEIDASCAPAFGRHLREALAEGPGPVLVDLGEVTFIDLVTVGQLVQALAWTGWRSGSIRLVSPAPFVRRVLELTRVTAVLPVYETLTSALAVPRA